MKPGPMKYRGFDMQPDKMLGFSLISPKGAWCQSGTSKGQLMRTVDSIIESDIERMSEKSLKAKIAELENKSQLDNEELLLLVDLRANYSYRVNFK